MFGRPYNWPSQNYRVNPAPIASSNVRPTSVNSAPFLKRDFPQAFLANVSGVETKEYAETLESEDASPAESEYHLEDMNGNEVDVKDCGFLYDDSTGNTMRLHDVGVADIATVVQLHDTAITRSDSAPTMVVSTKPKALVVNTIPTETGTGQIPRSDKVSSTTSMLPPPWESGH